ncbi:MAG: hypothetical protein HY791_08300 [Deltaproteobacteria bacterium]|nr:hypothetical protein [Deltaproteobacteria bacterium]
MRTSPAWLLALALPACAAQRLVVPEPPSRVPTSIETHLEDVSITVDANFRGLGPYDHASQDPMIHSLSEYLRAYGPYRSVSRERPSPGAKVVPVSLELSIALDTDRSRTWILDVIAAYPFLGLFPFTPEWGEVSVAIIARPSIAELTEAGWRPRQQLTPIELTVKAAFSKLAYSWWRTEPEEDAYRRAYEMAFDELGRRLRRALERSVSAYRPEFEEEFAARSTRGPKPIEPKPKAPSRCSQTAVFISPVGAGFRPSFAATCREPPKIPDQEPTNPADSVSSPELDSANPKSANPGPNSSNPSEDRPLHTVSATRALAFADMSLDALGLTAPVVVPTSTTPASGSEAEPPQTEPTLEAPHPGLPHQSLDSESLTLAEPNEFFIDEPGLRILVRPVSRTDASLVERYLASLGGVEVSAFAGLASVQSSIHTETHPNEVVGSGKATSAGYRVSLYKPPDRTGFFFPASLGFLSEDVRIDGFLEEIPVAQIGGADTIGARITDPVTGEEDLEPINYFLRMRSGYLTQNIALSLVVGTDDVQFFWTGRAGINLFEIRHLEVDLATSTEQLTDVRGFLSGSAGTQIGIGIPALHAALRAAVDFEWHDQFEYPTPLDFLASSTYDEAEEIYFRERGRSDAVSLTAWNAQVSGVVLF